MLNLLPNDVNTYTQLILFIFHFSIAITQQVYIIVIEV